MVVLSIKLSEHIDCVDKQWKLQVTPESQCCKNLSQNCCYFACSLSSPTFVKTPPGGPTQILVSPGGTSPFCMIQVGSQGGGRQVIRDAKFKRPWSSKALFRRCEQGRWVAREGFRAGGRGGEGREREGLGSLPLERHSAPEFAVSGADLPNLFFLLLCRFLSAD